MDNNHVIQYLLIIHVVQCIVLYLSLYLLYTVGVLYYTLYICNFNDVVGLGKGFECLNFRLFAAHSKLNFSLQSFTAMPTLMFAHVHFCNLNVWSIMWACSRKVEAVLLAASVSIHCPAMLNPSRNSNRNKTSTRYKAIIQFWRHSIANQGKGNIDKTRANLRIFVHFC